MNRQNVPFNTLLKDMRVDGRNRNCLEILPRVLPIPTNVKSRVDKHLCNSVLIRVAGSKVFLRLQDLYKFLYQVIAYLRLKFYK